MNRRLVMLSTLSKLLVLCGCGTTLRSVEIPSAASAPTEMARAVPAKNEAAPMRIPGDFAVYRIWGSYREAPVALTQRMVERQGGVLLLDLSIEDGGKIERLRMRIDDSEEHRGELLSVAKMEAGVMMPFGRAAFEQRMGELLPAADDNQGEIARRGELLKVGATPLEVVRTDYRVRIGAHHGVMSTLSAEGFPWDNLGGRIVADDGTVIYQAQLVELGNQQPNSLPSGRTLHATASDLYDELDE
jgi:hypothetical protein